LRISFAGGGTDVPPYPETKGGAVLSTAITRYCRVTLRPRADGKVRVASQDYDIALTFPADRVPPNDGRLDLIKGVLRAAGDLDRGCDLLVRSDVAPGSGLGASSSLVIAALAVVHAWKRIELKRYDLAELAYKIERLDLRMSGGKQDQYAAAYGGFNYIEFLGRTTRVCPLYLPRPVLNELDHHLLLWYTGESHPERDLIGEQAEAFRAGKEAVADSLDELKQIASEMRDALEDGNLRLFGRLMAQGWECKKRLADGITTGRIDELYNAACHAGAAGGKLLGSGGGGHLLLFCPDGTRARVVNALAARGGHEVPLGFCRHGVDVWEAGAGD